MTPLDPVCPSKRSLYTPGHPNAVVLYYRERERKCARRVVALVSSICCVCLSEKYQISNTILLLVVPTTPHPHRPQLHIRLEAMPSIILTNTAPACTREDGLPNAVGRGGWFIDVQQGSLRQLKRSDMSARRHHWREGSRL
jgi:hypothetical protein